MKIDELRKKMQSGDWNTIGKLLGITPHNAYVSFLRPQSKRYAAIVEAVEKLIANRDELLTKSVKDEKGGKKHDASAGESF